MYFPTSLLRTTRPILPLFLAPSLAAMLALPLQSSSVLASQHPFSPSHCQGFGYQDFPAVQIRLWVCLLQSCITTGRAVEAFPWSISNPQSSTQSPRASRKSSSTYAACRKVEARRFRGLRSVPGTRGISTFPLRGHQFPHRPKHKCTHLHMTGCRHRPQAETGTGTLAHREDAPRSFAKICHEAYRYFIPRL